MRKKHEWNTLSKRLNDDPNLKEKPLYKPTGSDSWPQSFENALLMIAKKNHANPRRFNLEDKFTMDGVIENIEGKPIFYYDAEYSNNDLVNDGEKLRFWDIHVPIEKIEYFKKYDRSVYVRGNLQNVLVLLGSQIVEAFGNDKILWDAKTVVGLRDFISVHVGHAYSKNALKTGPLSKWMVMVKELMGLDYYWC